MNTQTLITIIVAIPVAAYCLILGMWIVGSVVMATREGIRRGRPLVSAESINGGMNVQ